MQADHYKTLQVHPEASAEVITKAYKTLVQTYHPDKYHVTDRQRMEERMKAINAAYDVLSDPKLRQRYDLKYPDILAAQQAQHNQPVWLKAISKSSRSFIVTVFVLIAALSLMRGLWMIPLVRYALVLTAGFFILRLVMKQRQKASR